MFRRYNPYVGLQIKPDDPLSPLQRPPRPLPQEQAKLVHLATTTAVYGSSLRETTPRAGADIPMGFRHRKESRGEIAGNLSRSADVTRLDAVA